MEVISLLSEGVLDATQLAAIVNLDSAEEYEYTGSGYFLTLSHPALPVQQQTLSFPFVVGTSGDIQCGFVGFLGSGKLVLECHTWGAVDVPQDFRNMDIIISTEEMNVIRVDV